MICSLAECGEGSSLHLCEEHRFELADLLDNVDFLIVNLDPNIQATKVTKKAGGQEGGNGTKSAGSRPPTLDTVQLRAWLWELPRNAYVEARDNPTAGQTLHMARIWVGNARTLVYGADDDNPEPDKLATMRAQLAEEFPDPLPPTECANWLRANAGIKIHSGQINKWFHRGRIHKQEGSTPKRPLYSAKEVLIAHMTRQHEGS